MRRAQGRTPGAARSPPAQPPRLLERALQRDLFAYGNADKHMIRAKDTTQKRLVHCGASRIGFLA